MTSTAISLTITLFLSISTVILLMPGVASAAMNAVQRQALVTLYDALRGPAWTMNVNETGLANNWRVEGSDACAWSGVTCDPTSTYVVKLDLYRYNMVGQFPHAVLPVLGASLASLNIAENFVALNISLLYTTLPNAVFLNLGRKYFRSQVCVFPWSAPIMPDCSGAPDGGIYMQSHQPLSINPLYGSLDGIGKLKNLQYFHVMGTDVVGTIPAEVCNLRSLAVIDVLRASITGTLPECMGNMTNLQVIMLNTLGLSGTIPPSFSTLPNLVKLSMGGNRLEGQVPDFPPKAIQVILSENRFTGTLPKAQKYVSPDGVMVANLLETVSVHSNDIGGTLPEDWGQMQNLKFVWLTGNKITGTFPATWGNMRFMLMFAIDRNELEGTLPNVFLGWLFRYEKKHIPPPVSYIFKDIDMAPIIVGARTLRLRLNKFNGTLPLQLRMHPTLIDLDIAQNQFEGQLNETFTSNWIRMEKLTAQENNFVGNLHDTTALCQYRSMFYLDLSNNNITGSIPPCFGDLEKLQSVSLKRNRIYGTLPPELSRLGNLQYLELAYNNISGSLPDTFSNLLNLRGLDLGHNQISGDIYENIAGLSLLPYMTSVVMPNNKLTGVINAWLLLQPGNDVKWLAMKSWNFANNGLTGTLPNVFDQYCRQLTLFNVRGNNLEGEIPDFPNLDVLDVEGNTKMRHSTNSTTRLPGFLATTSFMIQTGSYLCPQLTGSTRSMVATVDPIYYDYVHCVCDAGYYGTPPNCIKCLPKGTCPGGYGRKMIIPAGYYPSPSLEDAQYLVPCYSDSRTSPCNPDSLEDYACASGYTGRLCSSCVPGYFKKDRQCVVCPPKSVMQVSLVLGALVLVIIAVVLKRWAVGRGQFLNMTKVVVVHVQVLSLILAKSGFQWPGSMMSFTNAGSIVNLSPGFIDCVNHVNYFDVQKSTAVLGYIAIAGLVAAFVASILAVADVVRFVMQHTVEEAERKKSKKDGDDAVGMEDRRPRDSDDSEAESATPPPTMIVTQNESGQNVSASNNKKPSGGSPHLLTSGDFGDLPSCTSMEVAEHEDYYAPESDTDDGSDNSSEHKPIGLATFAFNTGKPILMSTDPKLKQLRIKFMFVRFFMLFLQFFYLPVSAYLLQVFNCEEDPGLDKMFMVFDPNMECNFGNPDYQESAAIALSLLPIYVLGFPLWIIYVSSKFQRGDLTTRHTWFFLFVDFRKGCEYHLAVQIIRKLLLVITLSLVPATANLASFFLLVQLPAYLAVHMYTRPYAFPFHNNLETVSLAVINITFVCGAILSTGPHSDLWGVQIVLFVVNLLFALYFVYGAVLASHLPPGVTAWPLYRGLLKYDDELQQKLGTVDTSKNAAHLHIEMPRDAERVTTGNMNLITEDNPMSDVGSRNVRVDRKAAKAVRRHFRRTQRLMEFGLYDADDMQYLPSNRTDHHATVVLGFSYGVTEMGRVLEDVTYLLQVLAHLPENSPRLRTVVIAPTAGQGTTNEKVRSLIEVYLCHPDATLLGVYLSRRCISNVELHQSYGLVTVDGWDRTKRKKRRGWSNNDCSDDTDNADSGVVMANIPSMHDVLATTPRDHNSNNNGNEHSPDETPGGITHEDGCVESVSGSANSGGAPLLSNPKDTDEKVN
eukprot:PhM_4_TR4215/c0_g1_i1/m.17111